VAQHVVLVHVVLLVVAVGRGDPQRGDAQRLGEDPERQGAAQCGQRHRLGVAVPLHLFHHRRGHQAADGRDAQVAIEQRDALVTVGHRGPPSRTVV
jgi:hypothetical protein